MSQLSESQVKKPVHSGRRKRKTSSCDSCRKLKTRCDFEPIVGKCHRCNVLKMDCSLTLEKNEEIIVSINKAEQELELEESDKAEKLDSKMDTVLEKLDYLIRNSTNQRDIKSDATDKSIEDYYYKNGMNLEINNDYKFLEGLGTIKFNYLDNSFFNSPLNVISKIDSKLFKRIDSYEFFNRFCQEEFLEKFYYKNQELCLRLSTEFLTTAHFWIIPGGITRISDDYVKSHPFITAVFILISMGFDEEYQFSKQQEELFWIVKKILGVASNTSPITDHDVEAILYCSLYNIGRKPYISPNHWSVSADGIKQLMILANFANIKERVLNKIFEPDDLYHLRIWTLLNICHSSNSIGFGRAVLIPQDYFEDIYKLVMNYPQITLGDNINYAHLKLNKIVHKMFYSHDLFQNVIKYNQFQEINSNKVFKFLEIHNWFEKWKELIDMDTSGTLLFNCDFYHVILSRRFISFYTKINQPGDFKVKKYLDIGYNTVMFYSMSILTRVLNLPRSLIRGSPINLWNQVVYSCLTLYEYNSQVEDKFNLNPLNLISRVYWHLNKIGGAKNDATDTVGQIIGSLVDVNRSNVEMVPSQNNGGYTNTNTTNNSNSNLPPETEEDYKPLHDEVNHEFSNINFDLKFNNMANFETFEDFFNDLNK